MPTTGSSSAIRRTASSSWRADRPPGSGVPVPGAWPGSHTSMSTERNTPSQSSVAIANASVRHSSRPRVTISVISNERIRCSAIQSRTSGGGQYPRRPTCRNRSPRTAPDSMSSRIGCPCPISEPNSIVPVSACASKWMRETRPQPSARATPVAFGHVTVWSPPSTTGIAPAAATLWTWTSSAAQAVAASPENISTSPASSTLRSCSPSVRSARLGRDPSCAR